jgi:Fur family ferric uptake transcriptional regulator
MILITDKTVVENENGYNLKMGSSPAAPVRMTKQRRALQAALEAAPGFVSAQDLYGQLRAEGHRIGLATVYTQLRHMAEHGQLDVIRADGGESLYRRCGAGEHHHHLRCRSCGQVTELAAPAVETWASEVARSSGYAELSHSLEITGICPECAHG